MYTQYVVCVYIYIYIHTYIILGIHMYIYMGDPRASAKRNTKSFRTCIVYE